MGSGAGGGGKGCGEVGSVFMRGGVLGCPCVGGLFSATGVLPPPPPPQAVSANNAIMANAIMIGFMPLPFDCGRRVRAARRWWAGPARLASLLAPRPPRNPPDTPQERDCGAYPDCGFDDTLWHSRSPRCGAPSPHTLRMKRPRASPTAPRVGTALAHVHSAIDTMPVGLRPAIPHALGAMARLRRAPLDNPPALRAWTRRASGNHHGPRGAVSTSTRRKGAWRATKRVHAPPRCAAALDTAPLHARPCSHVGHAGEHGAARAPIQAHTRPEAHPRPMPMRPSAPSRPCGQISPSLAHTHTRVAGARADISRVRARVGRARRAPNHSANRGA